MFIYTWSSNIMAFETILLLLLLSLQLNVPQIEFSIFLVSTAGLLGYTFQSSFHQSPNKEPMN